MLATADRADESAGWGAAPCGHSRGRHQWRILTGEMQAVKRRGHGEAREGEALARTGAAAPKARARGPDAVPFASPSAAGLREPERPEWPFDGVEDGMRGGVARDTRDRRQPLERHAGFCFNNRWGRRLQRRIMTGKFYWCRGHTTQPCTEHQTGGGAASAGSMPPSASSLGAAGPARSRAGTSGCTGWFDFDGPAPFRWWQRRTRKPRCVPAPWHFLSHLWPVDLLVPAIARIDRLAQRRLC